MEIPDDHVIQPNIRRPNVLELHLPRDLEVSPNTSYMRGSEGETALHRRIATELIQADQANCPHKDAQLGCIDAACTACNLFDRSTIIETRTIKVFLKNPARWQESLELIRSVARNH